MFDDFILIWHLITMYSSSNVNLNLILFTPTRVGVYTIFCRSLPNLLYDFTQSFVGVHTMYWLETTYFCGSLSLSIVRPDLDTLFHGSF